MHGKKKSILLLLHVLIETPQKDEKNILKDCMKITLMWYLKMKLIYVKMIKEITFYKVDLMIQ